MRGPVAYIFGHRYMRLKSADGKVRRDDALLLFRTAQKDAPAGSALERLVQQELKRLESK